jgi:ATP-binding cassette, subfamily G (WHITE), eye pigment precursor transporter
VDKIIKELNL